MTKPYGKRIDTYGGYLGYGAVLRDGVVDVAAVLAHRGPGEGLFLRLGLVVARSRLEPVLCMSGWRFEISNHLVQIGDFCIIIDLMYRRIRVE